MIDAGPFDRHRLIAAHAGAHHLLGEVQVDAGRDTVAPCVLHQRVGLLRIAGQAGAHRLGHHPGRLARRKPIRQFGQAADRAWIAICERGLHRNLQQLGRIIVAVDSLNERTRDHRFTHPQQQPRTFRREVCAADAGWRIDRRSQRAAQEYFHPPRSDRRVEPPHQRFEIAAIGIAERVGRKGVVARQSHFRRRSPCKGG